MHYRKQRLGKARSGGSDDPCKIWSRGQKFNMAFMKINVTCYMIKLDLTLTLPSPLLKNGPECLTENDI